MISDQDQRNDASSWESYWKLAMSDPAFEAPWNFGPVEMAMPYLSELTENFDSSLPLVDFGCGDGVLTGYLAECFDVVVGVDISEAAVAKARRDNKKSNVSYEQLDGTDTVGVGRLRSRLGDANVHLRGVLHAMMPPDWPRALESLEILVGDRGRVFDTEVSQETPSILQDIMEHLDELPAGMPQCLACGLVPNALSAADLEGLYRGRGWSIQAVGNLAGPSLLLPDGNSFVVPFSYVITTKGSAFE